MTSLSLLGAQRNGFMQLETIVYVVSGSESLTKRLSNDKQGLSLPHPPTSPPNPPLFLFFFLLETARFPPAVPSCQECGQMPQGLLCIELAAALAEGLLDSKGSSGCGSSPTLWVRLLWVAKTAGQGSLAKVTSKAAHVLSGPWTEHPESFSG